MYHIKNILANHIFPGSLRLPVVIELDDEMNNMTKKQKEIASLLRKLNLSKSIAGTLACISCAEEISSREIEMASRLRQPEVSIAMEYLRKKRGWVACDEIKKSEGKGRPVKMYRLAVPMDEIIEALEREIIEENEEMLNSISRLKTYS